MREGISICLAGANANETAGVLAARLLEMGRGVERLDTAMVDRLGGGEAAAFVCRLLARNGVIVVVTCNEMRPEGECLDIEIDPNDTPDFAAEKILDALAEAGFVDLAAADCTPEEEEEIRRRLADLGYIE